MKKILVTGGAGFVGSNIVNELVKRGYQVVVFDNLSRGFRKLVNKKAKIIVGSLYEIEKLRKALKGVDVVIHTAGLAIVPESFEKVAEYRFNNFVGSWALLHAMLAAKVKNIVFSSSCCVYGKPDKLPLTENSPKNPLNPYGFTKVKIEEMLNIFHLYYGMNVVILRYFNPYGFNEIHEPETHIVPNVINAVLHKKPIPLYWKGQQVRDFIYVKDLASAHIEVMDLKGFHVYNVGTGKGVKIIDLIKEVFKIVGYKVPLNHLGKRPGDFPKLYASTTKIKKEIGWTAKTDLEQGLRETIKWFKSQYGKQTGR